MSGDLLAIQFRGIDEGADPKSQPAGTLLRALNCRMDKARRLKKRGGTDPLIRTLKAGGSIAAGTKLVAYPSGDIGLLDSQKLYGQDPTTDKWIPIEETTSPFTVRTRSLAEADRGIVSVDTVISGDLMFSVYEQSGLGTGTGGLAGRMYFQVENVATGQTVHPPTLVDYVVGGTRPRLLLGATAAHIVFLAPAALYTQSIDLVTFALGTLKLLAIHVAASTSRCFDAILINMAGGEAICVAYELDAGANRMILSTWLTATYAFQVSNTVAGSGGAGITRASLAYCPLADVVAVIWSSGTVLGCYAATMTRAMVSVVTMTPVIAAWQMDSVFIAEYDATHLIVGATVNRAYDIGVQDLVHGHVVTATLSDAGLGPTYRLTICMTNATKPWKQGGRWFVGASVIINEGMSTTDLIPQGSFVVNEMVFADPASAGGYKPGIMVANLENQTGGLQGQAVVAQQNKAAVDADGNVWLASPYRLREPFSDNDSLTFGWNSNRIHLGGEDYLRTTQIGSGVLAACAAPLWLDGATALPYGFEHAPKIRSVTATAGGGLLAGTYSYVAMYVWIDANGVKHRSIPSPPFSGTTAGGNLTLTVVIGTTALGAKSQNGRTGTDIANQVIIELYRTTNLGTIHYRLLECLPANQTDLVGITVTDSFPDTDISSTGTVPLSSQLVVYTETGELADVPPPALITCATHRGRLCGIDGTLRTVWFSKDQTEDTKIAPGFNEVLVLSFAGDKSSLASMDDKLAVLGPSSVDVVFGAGPDATGAGEWQVQLVQSDVGCVNPKATVACPSGVLFESQNGISLLTRDLVVTWVGKVVEDTLAQFPVITSAVLAATDHEVRFTCNAADGVTGIVLAWDYFHQIWFTRTYTDVDDTADASVPFVDAAIVNGVYTLLTAGGQIYQETKEHFLDSGTLYVERDILLAPISPAGPMGWCRVKDLSLLGTGVSDHDLSVSLARDYATSFEQTKSFAATTPPVAVGPLTKCRITYKNQQCRATQIRIQDLTPTAGTLGDGEGAIYEGLALRVTVKPTVAKTAPTEQG